MAKIYVQDFPLVWGTNAALSGCATSGSFLTDGYARLVGTLISCTSAVAASGLLVRQGYYNNGALTWIHQTPYAPAACTASAYSIELVGNVAQVEFRPDTTASIFATVWQLRPI